MTKTGNTEMPPYQFFKNSKAINKNKVRDSKKELFEIFRIVLVKIVANF